MPTAVLYMLHGDADVLVLLEDTCIYFDWIPCAYDWVSKDQDGYDGICCSVIFILFYFDMTDGS